MNTVADTKPVPRRWCVGVATIAILALAGLPGTVRAQGYTPIYAVDFGNPDLITDEGVMSAGSRKKPYSLALGILPSVGFFQSGDLFHNGIGTRDVTGTIVALDIAFAPIRNGVAIDLGTWYFRSFDNFGKGKEATDIWEVHTRIFASARRDIGIQLGTLKTFNVNSDTGLTYTAYVVTEYSSQRAQRRTRYPWAVQVGGGVFIDPLYDRDIQASRTTVGASLFVSGALDLGRGYNLTLSEWYVRDRTIDNNRLGLGIGYKF